MNMIWDFILISFRFFGEPEGIAKCYYAEFKRLDKFFVESSTLPVADSEIIVDIFKYCINIFTNLLKERDIEILPIDAITNCEGTDVVMQETVLPRVANGLGSTSLADLIPPISCNNSNTLIMKDSMSPKSFYHCTKLKATIYAM